MDKSTNSERTEPRGSSSCMPVRYSATTKSLCFNSVASFSVIELSTLSDLASSHAICIVSLLSVLLLC